MVCGMFGARHLEFHAFMQLCKFGIHSLLLAFECEQKVGRWRRRRRRQCCSLFLILNINWNYLFTMRLDKKCKHPNSSFFAALTTFPRLFQLYISIQRQCQIHLSEAAGYESCSENKHTKNGLVLHANGITTSRNVYTHSHRRRCCRCGWG